ncbi:MAG TPA: hypothetical protein VI728_04745 [Syntrophales bacterium]|nr:hypothetical protein [Syntrophales bacterium]
MSEAQLDKVSEMLEENVKHRFYGEILIKFENGKITLIKKTENIKI